MSRVLFCVLGRSLNTSHQAPYPRRLCGQPLNPSPRSHTTAASQRIETAVHGRCPSLLQPSAWDSVAVETPSRDIRSSATHCSKMGQATCRKSDTQRLSSRQATSSVMFDLVGGCHRVGHIKASCLILWQMSLFASCRYSSQAHACELGGCANSPFLTSIAMDRGHLAHNESGSNR